MDDLVLHRRRRRRMIQRSWVLAGAGASTLFAAATFLLPLFAYYYHWISPSAMKLIVDVVWPFVMVIEISLQIIPMIIRQQTQGWDVVIDQWSSYLPMAACLIIVALAALVKEFSMAGEGWRMWFQSLSVAFIEAFLVAAGNKMIAAARGSEETQV